MYAWIWNHLPFGLRGRIAGSALLVGLAVALLWYVVFPWLDPFIEQTVLPWNDGQLEGDFTPAGDPGLGDPAAPGGVPEPTPTGPDGRPLDPDGIPYETDDG
jgi:hypothetical protein